jgi:hypothetical protein
MLLTRTLLHDIISRKEQEKKQFFFFVKTFRKTAVVEIKLIFANNSEENIRIINVVIIIIYLQSKLKHVFIINSDAHVGHRVVQLHWFLVGPGVYIHLGPHSSLWSKQYKCITIQQDLEIVE